MTRTNKQTGGKEEKIDHQMLSGGDKYLEIALYGQKNLAKF